MSLFEKILLIVALFGLMALILPAEENGRINGGRGQNWNLRFELRKEY